MLSQFFNSDFWFIKPSTILTSQDRLLAYFFVGILILAVISAIVRRLAGDKVKSRLAGKFFYLFLNIGIVGIIWFGFRYENSDVLGLRYWAGLIILTGLIWLGFVLKFAIFNFPQDLKEYRHNLVKNKYIVGSKSR